MNFESPKTHQKHTSHTAITLTNFQVISFQKKKSAEMKKKTSTKKIPPFDGQAQAAVLPRLLLVRDPTVLEVASLLRGVSFSFWFVTPQKPQGSGN